MSVHMSDSVEVPVPFGAPLGDALLKQIELLGRKVGARARLRTTY